MTVPKNHMTRSTRDRCYIASPAEAFLALFVSVMIASITGCSSSLTESELNQGKQISVGYSEAEVRKIFSNPPQESPGENNLTILTWVGGGGQLDVYFSNGIVVYVDWRRDVIKDVENEWQRIIELMLVLLVSAIAIALYLVRRRKSLK